MGTQEQSQPSHMGEDDEQSVDLRKYWSVLSKHRWIIAGVTIVVTALSIVYTVRQPKIFQAITTVIVDPVAPKAMGKQFSEVVELGSGNFWGNDDYYKTQYRILTSRALAAKVVRKFHLDRDKRFLPDPPAGSQEEERINIVAGVVQNMISFLPVKGSRVVAITVTNTNPSLVAELANQVADVYIEQNRDVKLDATRDAKRWVAKQLDEARNTLRRSETELYGFRRDNNILSVALEDRQNMITTALGSISAELTKSTTDRINLQTKRKAIARLIETEALSAPSSFMGEAKGIQQVRDMYLNDRRDLIALEQTYGPKHPQVIELKARVDAAMADLQEEGRTLLRAVDAEILALQDAEKRFGAEQQRLTDEALAMNQKEIEYKRLSRDARNSSEVYTLLLQRFNESGLEEQDKANNIRPLDAARGPSLVGPNHRRTASLGFALGLGLGIAFALLLDFVDRTVKTQEDIEVTAGLPFLGLVPSVEELGHNARGQGMDELHILQHPTSTVAECCRVLRTNILFASPDKPLKTLLVTSSNPVEGKTTTVVNLGVVMAQSGHRTLIVDTDMRRPRLHKVLGTSNENGISRLILGESDIESAIKATAVPGLFLLPCGPIPPNPAELLQTEKFAAVARKLIERFDRVIFDSPPTLVVTDAAVLSRVTDGAVVVVRAGKTNRDALKRAKHSLKAVKAPIIGVVLNDVDLKNPHYQGYYDYYTYKYQDKKSAPVSATPSQSG